MAASIDFDATGGSLTDTGGDLAVTGTSTLTVTGTDVITLDVTTNDLNTVLVTAGRDVTLVDTDDITLGASTIGGLLDVDAAGIDVAGAVGAGSAHFDATGGNLTDSTGSLSVTGTSTDDRDGHQSHHPGRHGKRLCNGGLVSGHGRGDAGGCQRHIDLASRPWVACWM
ncbi:MAG: hypothetical protein U5O39_18980 [Gammaproteobacteria bacterium]|nr:hypothetical protein [Gammaproteobacteria bacterium]